ncbi:receptor like protein 30-like [Cucumis melo var. makuwa]|uniref:Receptor like protein 30-like n=1 Tax=Cucumis melo var. makuwa TaxID=1194695 RepID=A0A5A7TCX1_CUCMM|nr:receptor like protein 30-like [Cucumis melo var. makuwa]TYK24557.1 receptor like protein 30-like [Cucumis melo var. makuwa]
MSKWNESTDCCLWDGVECDDKGQGHVVGLHLGCSLLQGPLHPNSTLFTLSHLQTLNLSYNEFLGSPISPQFGIMLTKLRVLDLSYSSFQGQGEISESIYRQLNLIYLVLNSNNISGVLDLDMLLRIPNLSVLQISNSSQLSIFSTNGSFSNLTYIECELRSLDLNDNQIEGELPQSLLNCRNLEVLDLGNNNITGYFPYWLKAALNLQVLILRSNRFYGHINNSFTKDSFSNLRIIDLSHNYFSGPLPSKFFNNMRAIQEVENQKSNFSLQNYYYRDSIVISLKGLEQSLEINLFIWKTIDLSSNDFNGEIPKEIGTLRSLVGLNLSHNKLRGGIPTSLGNLSNLEWLDLSSNELFGSIPPQLVSLTFLSCLNLSQNQLSGPIPKGKQFDTFENSSYFGNIGLCGSPLPKCDADQSDHKSQLLQKEEEEDDSSEKGIWVKAVFTGYGCGIVFGIFIGYVVFKCGRPMWIVAKVEGKRAQKIQTSRKNNKPRRRNE